MKGWIIIGFCAAIAINLFVRQAEIKAWSEKIKPKVAYEHVVDHDNAVHWPNSQGGY